MLEGASFGRALTRSRALARNRVGFCLGVWLAAVLLPALGATSMDVLGNALVGFVLQLGHPTGELFSDGGSGFAVLGALLAVPLVAAVALPRLRRPAHPQGRLGHPAALRRARRAERPRTKARGVSARPCARARAGGGERHGGGGAADGAGGQRDARARADRQLPAQGVPPLVKEVFARDFSFCGDPSTR